MRANPKVEGSAAHGRYERYKKARTLQKARDLGAQQVDIVNDFQHGYLKRRRV